MNKITIKCNELYSFLIMMFIVYLIEYYKTDNINFYSLSQYFGSLVLVGVLIMILFDVYYRNRVLQKISDRLLDISPRWLEIVFYISSFYILWRWFLNILG